MNQNKRFILASASPRRRELLKQIGIEPEIIPSRAMESTDIGEPDLMVEELSRRKCLDVAADIDDGIILGADTVVCISGEILGKPKDKDDAARMLKKLSGKVHQVYTGVTIVKREGGCQIYQTTFSVKTDVSVVKMSEVEIEAYIAEEKPFDKAGAYGIQGGFSRFIDRIEGDYFNVVGLPVAAVYSRLRDLI